VFVVSREPDVTDLTDGVADDERPCHVLAQNQVVTKRLLASAVLVLAAAIGTACSPSDAPPPGDSSAAASTSVAASPSAAPTTQAAAETRVVNVVPVIDGQPANGYRDTTPSDANSPVSMCDASPSGVGPEIYRCSPSAAGADVCYPSTAATLLCVNDPWKKQLHRVTTADPLPTVAPVSAPVPFALLLDDGTHCRIRNGGAWGGRDDGLVGAYGCNGTDVVLMATQDGAEPVDRSQPLWTVKVGPLGAGNIHFPPPQTHAVTTAWFAAVSSPHA
jgi:serine/threonine-protein kinase